MHIPDGFLNSGTASSLIGVVAVIGALAVNKIRQGLFKRVKSRVLKTPEGAEFSGSDSFKLTKLGKSRLFRMFNLVLFILFIQYFDLFVIAGHPVHFLGIMLAAILVGPWAGMVVMAVVLIFQASAFGDGGIFALGANIFNMGVVGVIGGYYIYKFFKKRIKNYNLAVFTAVVVSIFMASIFYFSELLISGQIYWDHLPTFIGVHLLLGVIEGLFTIAMLKILKTY